MSTIDVKVPDIGDFKDVPVIQVQVKPGDTVKAEDPLVTLESDKATIDIPSPRSGTVLEVKVKVGDRVSEGRPLVALEAADEAVSGPRASRPPAPPRFSPVGAARTPEAVPVPVVAPPPASAPRPPHLSPRVPSPPALTPRGSVPGVADAPPFAARLDTGPTRTAHASPSVRRLARELGVDLSLVTPSGPKGRLLKEDVERFVREAVTQRAAPVRGGGLEVLPWPDIDFAKYGPIEVVERSRVQRSSAANLARNWVMIPHVTQFEEADVTELEALRTRLNEAKQGPKVTLLAFVMKAAAAALRRFPTFNASLRGEDLVVKRFFHLGFAADTPHGLVVPVVRDVDQKGVHALAQELAELAQKAREGKLTPVELSGGTFSISSLGGLGGTAFTPIINAPEVAILGVSKAVTRPVWDGRQFAPRLMLPLSLSYDHRVIDGAAAARFTSHLRELLEDLRRVLL